MEDNEWPETDYILSETAYMPRAPGGVNEHLKKGTKVRYHGEPGPHMEPTDKAGEDARARVSHKTLNPLQRIPLRGQNEDSIMDQLRDALNNAPGRPTPLPGRNMTPPPPVPPVNDPPPKAPAVPPPPPPPPAKK
jgi:hypothetical protein